MRNPWCPLPQSPGAQEPQIEAEAEALSHLPPYGCAHNPQLAVHARSTIPDHACTSVSQVPAKIRIIFQQYICIYTPSDTICQVIDLMKRISRYVMPNPLVLDAQYHVYMIRIWISMLHKHLPIYHVNRRRTNVLLQVSLRSGKCWRDVPYDPIHIGDSHQSKLSPSWSHEWKTDIYSRVGILTSWP